MMAMRRNDRGASAVEFALLAPLFFMLTFGLITGAIMLNRQNNLTHSAREGARYGATLPVDQFNASCGAGSGTCWANHVRDLALERAFGEIDLAQTGHEICVSLVEGDPAAVVSIGGSGTYRTAGGTGPCYTDTGTDGARRVQISVRRPDAINAIFFRMSIPLSSEAAARHESS